MDNVQVPTHLVQARIGPQSGSIFFEITLAAIRFFAKLSLSFFQTNPSIEDFSVHCLLRFNKRQPKGCEPRPLRRATGGRTVGPRSPVGQNHRLGTENRFVAVSGAETGFRLVQGLPGTGTDRSIVGIVVTAVVVVGGGLVQKFLAG